MPRTQERTVKTALISVLAAFIPGIAWAYVDPGFLSFMFQFLYIAIFGAMSFLIFKPWEYLKRRFGKSQEDPDDSKDTAEAD